MRTLTDIWTPRRLWVALFGLAVIAFAICATGAGDCAIFKPLGLAAAFGAAGVSLFDAEPEREGEPEAHA